MPLYGRVKARLENEVANLQREVVQLRHQHEEQQRSRLEQDAVQAHLEHEVKELHLELATVRAERDNIIRQNGKHMRKCGCEDERSRVGKQLMKLDQHVIKQDKYIAFLEEQINEARQKYHDRMVDVKKGTDLVETELTRVRNELNNVVKRAGEIDTLKKKVRFLMAKIARRDEIISKQEKKCAKLLTIVDEFKNKSAQDEGERLEGMQGVGQNKSKPSAKEKVSNHDESIAKLVEILERYQKDSPELIQAMQGEGLMPSKCDVKQMQSKTHQWNAEPELEDSDPELKVLMAKLERPERPMQMLSTAQHGNSKPKPKDSDPIMQEIMEKLDQSKLEQGNSKPHLDNSETDLQELMARLEESKRKMKESMARQAETKQGLQPQDIKKRRTKQMEKNQKAPNARVKPLGTYLPCSIAPPKMDLDQVNESQDSLNPVSKVNGKSVKFVCLSQALQKQINPIQRRRSQLGILI